MRGQKTAHDAPGSHKNRESSALPGQHEAVRVTRPRAGGPLSKLIALSRDDKCQ